MKLNKKFLSDCAEEDGTEFQDTNYLQNLQDQETILYEEINNLRKQQKNLSREWIDNTKVLDAFNSAQNLDDSKCDASSCILDKQSVNIKWIYCENPNHDEGWLISYV